MNTRSSTASSAAAASASSSELDATRATLAATQARLACVEKQLSALRWAVQRRQEKPVEVAPVCQHSSRLLMCTWNKRTDQFVTLTYQLDPALPPKEIEYIGCLPNLRDIYGRDDIQWDLCISCHKLIGIPQRSVEEWRRLVVAMKYGSDDEGRSDDHSESDDLSESE